MEIRAALDTNRLSDLFRGDSELADWLDICSEVWLPLVVIGEMKAGFLGGDRQQRNEALLSELLLEPT